MAISLDILDKKEETPSTKPIFENPYKEVIDKFEEFNKANTVIIPDVFVKERTIKIK